MQHTYGKRGFVTLATGNTRYYRLASNLLLSYRLNAREPLPFAIISDRRNRYTDQFDHVILMENPSFSYIDKLCLIDYLPFDETIFIDADSLAYADLNQWWESFEEAGDFCVFGWARKLDEKNGWFLYDGIREYRSHVSFIPSFNGGVYYIRNTETARKVFSIAKHCAEHYQEYSFNGFLNPADEPVLALGMAVCNCHPVRNQNDPYWEILFSPSPSRLHADITIPQVNYTVDNRSIQPKLIHWGNWNTERAIYHKEVWNLKQKANGSNRWLLPKELFCFLEPIAYLKRYYRAFKRRFKLKNH